jgi:hypothetical protein
LGIVFPADRGFGTDYGPDAEPARRFDRFKLYYVGESYGDWPITHVSKLRAFDRPWWSFVYGECTPPPDGGCLPPLEIQDWSACVRFLARYPGHLESFPFRGAKAAWVPSAGSFEVYTGRTTVVIFADDHRRQVGRALLNVRADMLPNHLKPPAPGAIRGHLRCQRKYTD